MSRWQRDDEGEREMMYAAASFRTGIGRLRRATRRDWLSFVAQLALVVGVELGDDLAHGLVAQADPRVGLANTVRVVQFETAHGFWVEPGVQSFFTQTHDFLGLAVGWAQVVPIFNALYGLGHVLVTLLFALWVFFFRRRLFGFLRNVFLLTNLLALVLYEAYPMAPPRLAAGLPYDGHPYRFLDSVFGQGQGLQIGFNEFAAMPSLHVGWALIVGLTLCWAAKPLWIRLAALCWPVVMLADVVVTGNHFIADGLGAAVVLLFALAFAVLIEWWRRQELSLRTVVLRLHHARHDSSLARPARRSLHRTVLMRRAAA